MEKKNALTPLRRARLLQGLTLHEVYRQAFIYPSRLSRLERGIAKPEKREIRALASLYALPAEFLFPELIETRG